MKSKFSDLLRGLANPFVPCALPVGTLSSPLDATGERNGLDMIEQVCAQHSVKRLMLAFDKYLGAPYGSIAIKKMLHLLVEDRIHALALSEDPPKKYNLGTVPPMPTGRPLDAVAAAAIAVPSPRITGRWRVAFAALLQCVVFLGNAVATGLFAASRDAEGRKVSVVAPAFFGETYWHPVLRAAAPYLDDSRVPFAVVVEPGYDVEPKDGIPLLRPEMMPVERRRWWGEIVWPGFRLAVATVVGLLRRPDDDVTAAAAWSVMHLARGGLDFARLLHGLDVRTYLDVTEYSASHIVKAALLDRHGGHLVRWPYCVLDSPGATVSYLAYHMYLSPGPYEAQNFSGSWAPHTRSVPVGFFKNDRYWTDEEAQVSADYATRFGDALAAGRRIVVYFGPSAMPGRDAVVYETLKATVDAIIADPDCLLVVKAKGKKNAPQVNAALDRIDLVERLKDENRLIVIDYPEHGVEPCPAGWLIGKMAAGVGIGSVQLEALTQGKPLFSYMPFMQETPYQRKLTACALNHLTPQSLEAALRRWVEAPDLFEIPFGWFRENFDPYGDDRALSRIAAILWGDASASETAATPDPEISCQTPRTAHTA